MTDRQLSRNFKLHELLASQTAVRKKITEQFTPSPEVVENLEYLCVNLLENVRKMNGNKRLFVSSGYRCQRLNKAVGGVKNSPHLRGEAADIDFGSKAENKVFFEQIKNSKLVFDQLLNEFDYAWVHVSLKRLGNRREVVAAGDKVG